MRRELTPRERGLQIALDLQMREDPHRWRQLVDAIEDGEVRQVVDEYLRAILLRTRVAEAAKRQGGGRR